MNEQVFHELYEQRIKYPLGLGAINRDDANYISDELARQSSRNHKFLLLPAQYFDKASSRKIKEELLTGLYLVGVFDVDAALHPATGIKFYLYVFSEQTPQVVWFGELLNNVRPFKQRYRVPDQRQSLSPDYGELTKDYIKYLTAIDSAINNNKKTDHISHSYRMFGCDPGKVVQDRTSVDFYKPELIEAETKYAHEETVRLGDIATIIRPKERQEENKQAFSIKLSDATYPLRPGTLVPVCPSARVAKVQQGDIITNLFLTSAYQNLTTRSDLVISNSQLIIRLHDKRFDAAYITTYLNSERMRAYFERRKRGGFIPMITGYDLANFEIVVPTLKTNLAAKNFLKSLSDFSTTAERVKTIDRLLFAQNPVLDKPLQNELLSEIREQLQETKNIHVRELFVVDLHEIEKCYKSGAYKACLALCGSLLEALVLDWLSEVDNTNYFEAKATTNLQSLINKLWVAKRINHHEAYLAHEIRKKRNIIHPKKYITSPPLEQRICKEAMESLQLLVTKRFRREEKRRDHTTSALQVDI